MKKFYYIIILILSAIVFLSGALALAKERPKIGLVLSGGGAKGFAHIGTLKLIDSLKIPIDYVAGTSMGGIVCALYSIGYSPDEIENIARTTEWTEIFTDLPQRNLLPHFRKKNAAKFQVEFSLNDFTPVIPNSFIVGQKISLLLSRFVALYSRTTNFDSLLIPLRLIATDLVSGNEIVLSRGSLAKAMRSTMSIPTVFSPVEWDDYLLIDGGILNNFPVDAARNMGAQFVIGVNVGSQSKGAKNLNTILDVIDQTTSIPGFAKEKIQQKQTDILIKPDISAYTAADFDPEKINEIIENGNIAAIENIKKFLNLKALIDSCKTDSSIENNAAITKIKDPKEPKSIKNSVIHGIRIEGNQSLNFEFIFNLLGLKVSSPFDPDLIERRITDMYSLGYFETITYEILPVRDNYVTLVLKVKEKPFRKFLVGLRYDDQYKLVGIIGVQTTNVLLSGIRTEMELQFAGLTRFKFMVSYPTRSLDFPIYPYFRFNYKNVPVEIYDNAGNKMAAYSDNSSTLGLGLGFSFQKFWAIEADYNYEYMNIAPDIADRTHIDYYPNWTDKIRKFQASLDLDLLDEPILPRKGILVQADIEKAIKEFGSDVDYWRANILMDMYHTFNKYHTTRLYGYYCQSSQNLPEYKWFVLGGPESFIGYDYNQLIVDNFSFLRFDYRYEYKKDIFLKLIGNAGYRYNSNFEVQPQTKRFLWGAGFGVEFQSILGPLQAIFSWGEKSIADPGTLQSRIYITAGYKF